MALSPQAIRQTTFKTSRKGYDPGEVNAFLREAATALEAAQHEATAMEARARAAVARLQELSQQSGGDAGGSPAAVHAGVDESETISRTLLLAQRTADTTVAEAQEEADRLLAAARDDANVSLDAAREQAVHLVDDAKAEARRAGESERVQVEGEVQALLARRDFLESDVDHLEQYLIAQRERIVEAVGALNDIVHRIPDGLADMRRPLLSAAADPPLARAGADSVDDSDGDREGEGIEPAPDDVVVDAELVADDEVSEEPATEPELVVDELVVDEDDEIAEITRIASSEPTQQLSTMNPQDAGRG